MAVRERGRLALTLPGGETISVRVRRSDRALATRIVVRPGRSPEIVLAARAPEGGAMALLAARGEWLERALARMRATQVERLGLHRPGAVPLDGGWLAISASRGPRASARRAGDGGLRVVGRDREAMGRAVDRWYRREARALLQEVAAREADRLGVRHRDLTVRDPRSRWGSCSARGDISLSWRLALVPPAVRRYVVVHELLHLREANHGPAFWRLVAEAEPGHRRAREWLRDHGTEVLAFTPAPSLAG